MFIKRSSVWLQHFNDDEVYLPSEEDINI